MKKTSQLQTTTKLQLGIHQTNWAPRCPSNQSFWSTDFTCTYDNEENSCHIL